MMSVRVPLAPVVLVAALTMPAWAAPPPLILYEGRLSLADGGAPADGEVVVTFDLYDAPEGGQSRWTSTVPAHVVDGSFAVELGRVVPPRASLFDGDVRYLQIGLGEGDAAEALEPRQPVGGAPYALLAGESATLTPGAVADLGRQMVEDETFEGLRATLTGPAGPAGVNCFDGVGDTNGDGQLSAEDCVAHPSLTDVTGGVLRDDVVLHYASPVDQAIDCPLDGPHEPVWYEVPVDLDEGVLLEASLNVSITVDANAGNVTFIQLFPPWRDPAVGDSARDRLDFNFYYGRGRVEHTYRLDDVAGHSPGGVWRLKVYCGFSVGGDLPTAMDWSLDLTVRSDAHRRIGGDLIAQGVPVASALETLPSAAWCARFCHPDVPYEGCHARRCDGVAQTCTLLDDEPLADGAICLSGALGGRCLDGACCAPATREVRGGVDNDCDGQVDEGPCNGLCAPEVEDAMAEGAPGWMAIPPGPFWMGASAQHDPRHTPTWAWRYEPQRVAVSYVYLMMATEVTLAEWVALMGNVPRNHDHAGCGPDCPVTGLQPWEMAAYANALSRQLDLPECYVLPNCEAEAWCTPGLGHIPGGVHPDISECTGFRLPTEAEWVNAARAGAGTDELTYVGGAPGGVSGIAWYAGNSGASYPRDPQMGSGCGPADAGGLRCGLHPVGRLRPNAWGLYDMLGNAAEVVHGECQPDALYGLSPEPSIPLIDPWTTGDHCRGKTRTISRQSAGPTGHATTRSRWPTGA